jgi:hypothetical protein
MSNKQTMESIGTMSRAQRERLKAAVKNNDWVKVKFGKERTGSQDAEVFITYALYQGDLELALGNLLRCALDQNP